MRVLTYSDFRKNLAQSLNAVNDDREIVVVSRTKGKNVVIMDLEEYKYPSGKSENEVAG